MRRLRTALANALGIVGLLVVAAVEEHEARQHRRAVARARWNA